MRINRFAIVGRIVIDIVIVFFAQTNVFAQSNIDVVAHYLEVTPGEDGISYNVHVYFSVLDGSGNPITDLTNPALTIAEDGQKVEIQKLGTITEEPINTVLVMDTSGSMYGANITDAKSAAVNFVPGLMKPNDQAAVLTFDDNVRTQISFTSDQKTITDGITRIEAKREAGSCLYDAAYAAIQAVSTLGTGSRAVILFTDGRDETPNHAICSANSATDVINLASEGNTRAPIYTIGLGLGSDTETLKNISDQTGGLYLYASGSSKLANVFQSLSDRLRSQYILTYKSVSLPGVHTLTMSIDHAGAQAQDTRGFTLLPLPPHISFITPLEGETIGDVLKIGVSLSTQGEAVIQKVAFVVNGIEAGADDTKPYEVELDARQYSIGAMTVTAIAYDANNTELTRSSLNLFRAEATQVPQLVATEIVPVAAPPAAAETNNPIVYMAILLSGLSIITIGLLLFFLVRQQKQAKIREVESYDDNPITSMQGIPVYHKLEEIRKAGNTEPESDTLGALTIEASDDSSLVGHRFEITTSLITLGRSADNDIIFPNDKPVSRHHAEIYQISDKLYLREVETADSSGAAKPPKYGTFLNQAPMGPDPALLKTGDEIQLGKRVRLRFESYTRDVDDNALTSDDLAAGEDQDRTQEQ